MDITSSLVSLGIDFIPVHDLAPAFEILVVIWGVVQKASNTKRALRNLVVSGADILSAVNHLLSLKGMNEHVRDLLEKLEKVLTDIRMFSEEHVTTSVFKNLIRCNEIEGKIESFQNRLQNLSMAFNIAAYTTMETQLDKLLEMQRVATQVPPVASCSFTPGPELPRGLPVLKSSKPKRPVKDYDTVHVRSSSNELCRIQLCNGAPILVSRYLDDMDLSEWGLRISEAKFIKKAGGFDIVWPPNTQTWVWSVAYRTISISMHNPARSNWKDMLDIVFASESSAFAWFSWIEAYASANSKTPTQSEIPGCKVTVRKKYDCWMRKTPTHVERRRPVSAHAVIKVKDAVAYTCYPKTNSTWTITLSGHSRSCRDHLTHFNYVATGSLPFATVYRSGDTIVHERSVRADVEEPSTARRFCFDTEEEARAWYTVWKECALHQNGDSDPVQVGLTFKYPCTLELGDKGPVLTSSVSPELCLLDWGLRASKSPVTHAGARFKVVTVTTSWSWKHAGKQITVYATISSQPDWIDILEISFGSRAASLWFTYLLNYNSKTTPLTRPPEAAAVTVTNTRVCWMQKTQKSIETRTAMLDTWKPIFGDYKSMEVFQSHIDLLDTSSAVPHLRILHNNNILSLERRAKADASILPVSRDYQFGSKGEAKAWFEVWKAYLAQRVPVKHQRGKRALD